MNNTYKYKYEAIASKYSAQLSKNTKIRGKLWSES